MARPPQRKQRSEFQKALSGARAAARAQRATTAEEAPLQAAAEVGCQPVAAATAPVLEAAEGLAGWARGATGMEVTVQGAAGLGKKATAAAGSGEEATAVEGWAAAARADAGSAGAGPEAAGWAEGVVGREGTAMVVAATAAASAAAELRNTEVVAVCCISSR